MHLCTRIIKKAIVTAVEFVSGNDRSSWYARNVVLYDTIVLHTCHNSNHHTCREIIQFPQIIYHLTSHEQAPVSAPAMRTCCSYTWEGPFFISLLHFTRVMVYLKDIWFVQWMLDGLVIDWVIGWVSVWVRGWVVCWVVGLFNGWLDDWLVGLLSGLLSGWLSCWLWVSAWVSAWVSE